MNGITSTVRPLVENLEAREVLSAAQSLNPALLQILDRYLPAAVGAVDAQGDLIRNEVGVAAQLPHQIEHKLDVIANQIFKKLDGDVRSKLFNQVNNVSNNVLNRLEPQVQGNVLNQINNVGNNILNRPNNNPDVVNRLTTLNNATNNVLNNINNEFGNNNNNDLARNGPANNSLFGNADVDYSGASPLNF